MEMFKKEGLYFIPLGGADEIGLNMYAYVCNGRIIVVDVGYGFLNDDYPGMDLALPDASFLELYKDRIDGLFITHAHEDHFGAIGHIWPKLQCPVYGTDFAIGLIKERLKDEKLEDIVPLNIIPESRTIKLKNFEVEYVSVVHSVPETSALVIKTKYGNAVHATDWRFDDNASELLQTDYKALDRVSKEGVAMFVCDSTNILVDEKQPSEKDIRKSLMGLIPKFDKGLIATCFASNLVRLESLILAAHKAGRTPVLVGRSLVQNMRIAKECGYFKDLPLYLDLDNAKEISQDNVLYIATGSQANYRSALTMIANGEKRDLKLNKGDTVIFSSKIVPGNEEKIEAMQEKLIAKGVNIVTDSDYLVHTTGHASKAELKQMYELLKPQIVMPVHGEKRFVKAHQEFALQCGVKQVLTSRNGDVFLIKNNMIELVGEVPTDVFGIDRNQLTPLNSQLIKNRKRLAFNCSVFITLVLDKEWNISDLQISSIDILEENAWNELSQSICDHIKDILPTRLEALNRKEQGVSDFVRSQTRKKIENATGIKPVAFMHFYKEN